MFYKKTILLGSSCSLIGVIDMFSKRNKENKYSYEDVSKHNKLNDAWVTYGKNVYNVTNFINEHPGGQDKIMLAVGKGLEPYWSTYKQHTNDPDIFNDILKPMKIGELSDYDSNKYKNTKDPYVNDPIRDYRLNFHSTSPCIAETCKNSIMDNWITPNELWYVRNYHPVPNIDISNFELSIVNNDKLSKLSLSELGKLKTKKIVSTIQCGGNRRREYNNIDKTIGTPLNFGAISTAEWEGVLLRDLLINTKVTDQDVLEGKIKHIHFEAIDGVKISIPAEKAMNIYGDVLIAFKMNGEDIPKDHGYPLRLIVPGHVGIRNIKWLKSIKTSDQEIDGTWQRGISYKGLPHYIKDVKKVNLQEIASVQEMPVQSCIVDVNLSVIKGFAWCGGGRGIVRVDVSTDNGKTWEEADLKEGKDQNPSRAWAWTFWELKVKDDLKNKTIICKATDSSYNIQPEKIENIWNLRGLNNNSWHKIHIK